VDGAAANISKVDHREDNSSFVGRARSSGAQEHKHVIAVASR
jgi:hypothetical protein